MYRLVVFNPGVVHALPRTLAFYKFFSEVHYIDLSGKDNVELIKKSGLIYYPPFKSMRFADIKIQRLLRKINPDGIICHFATGTHFYNSIIFDKCPVAVIAMGGDILYEQGTNIPGVLEKYFIRTSLRKTDLISAKSVFLEDRLKSYNVNKPIDINYWGTDLKLFKPGNQFVSREKLGLNKNIKIILCPRTLVQMQNIDLIIKAFELIIKEIPDAKLLIIGKSHTLFKEKIVNMINTLNLTSSVELLSEVDNHEIIDYYLASDVVVSMSDSEGFPNTILEALACKVPVVVGNIPQIRELLSNNYNARICDFGENEIYKALSDVLKNTEKNKTILENGYKTVESIGNIEKNGERFAKKFIEEINRKRKKNLFKKFFYRVLYLILFFNRKLSKLIYINSIN